MSDSMTVRSMARASSSAPGPSTEDADEALLSARRAVGYVRPSRRRDVRTSRRSRRRRCSVGPRSAESGSARRRVAWSWPSRRTPRARRPSRRRLRVPRRAPPRVSSVSSPPERIRVARRQRRQAPCEFRLRLGGFFFDLFFEFFPERVSRESEPRSRLGSKRLHLAPVGVRRRRRGFHRGFGTRAARARAASATSAFFSAASARARRLASSRALRVSSPIAASAASPSAARVAARGLERRSVPPREPVDDHLDEPRRASSQSPPPPPRAPPRRPPSQRAERSPARSPSARWCSRSPRR